MKTELQKCMSGENYNCHDKIFFEYKNKARTLMAKYNEILYNQKTEKHELLRQLFGSIGTNVSVGFPFICEYGCNIHIGILRVENISVVHIALPVSIGDGCWIGGGVIILPGVTIGKGTVIGAGSVVTKNIPDNCVAVGNPCRIIRKIK